MDTVHKEPENDEGRDPQRPLFPVLCFRLLRCASHSLMANFDEW